MVEPRLLLGSLHGLNNGRPTIYIRSKGLISVSGQIATGLVRLHTSHVNGWYEVEKNRWQSS